LRNVLPARKTARRFNFLIGACLVVLSTAFVRAQTFQEAACYVFEGNENCRTVTIVDQDNCVIKVRPRSFADVDPSIAGCLVDDIETKKVFLRNANLKNAIASSHVGLTGRTALKSTVRISGREVVHVLTDYDQNGAPIWEPRNSYSFDLKGDPVRTAKALEHLSLNFCRRQQTPLAGRMPSSETAAVGINASPRVIGVNDAFRLAANESIVLIDIRHESEWRRTGVGVNAIPITMHQNINAFVKQLNEVTGPNNRKPIALICAGGVRSSYLQRALERYGFSGIIDVHEGMLGGPQGPGWIKSGLPTKPYNPIQLSKNR
jgi:rhodanese-related sulfurtransferase